MDDKKLNLKLNLWLEENKRSIIGLGLISILEKSKELGSLRQAAIEMKMSYRAAWGKIKKGEMRLCQRLLKKTLGKGQKFELTSFAEELIEKYKLLYERVEDYAVEEAKKIFECEVEKSNKRKKS